MKILTHFITSVLPLLALIGCSSAKNSSNESGNTSTTTDSTAFVEFNADSAYAFVKAQCDFGPRVPNSEAHRKCGDYLAAQLRLRGANVIEQNATLTTFDGTKLAARNIIAEFNPDSARRILLLAHWDCRPWADNDPDPAKRKQPVMGANDGASGVGVLLEMARIFSLSNPGIGVDILFVDAEDWGDHDSENSWALGTQYWVQNMHREKYAPEYGILLDMVGASGASFAKEYYSMANAIAIVNNVWDKAQNSGYGAYFPQVNGGGVTDDHVFLNRAGIRCIDIIDYRMDSESGFFPGWHTTADTFDVIDPATLKAVGQTLTNLLYRQ